MNGIDSHVLPSFSVSELLPEWFLRVFRLQFMINPASHPLSSQAADSTLISLPKSSPINKDLSSHKWPRISTMTGRRIQSGMERSARGKTGRFNVIPSLSRPLAPSFWGPYRLGREAVCVDLSLVNPPRFFDLSLLQSFYALKSRKNYVYYFNSSEVTPPLEIKRFFHKKAKIG
jgi:hypothetical protein